MIKKALRHITNQRLAEKRVQLLRNLMRKEAKIGGELFGPVPSGVRREFFCLDEHTWVWHEEWIDQQGQRVMQTTRYDVRPDGILKSQNGHYQSVSYQEARRLYDAAVEYRNRITKEVYSFVA